MSSVSPSSYHLHLVHHQVLSALPVNSSSLSPPFHSYCMAFTMFQMSFVGTSSVVFLPPLISFIQSQYYLSKIQNSFQLPANCNQDIARHPSSALVPSHYSWPYTGCSNYTGKHTVAQTRFPLPKLSSFDDGTPFSWNT